MSKYNRYAKRFADAFKKARDEHKEAYSEYLNAKKDYDAACAMWHESYDGEKEYKKATTKGRYTEAKKKLDAAAAWNDYDNTIKLLTAEINAEANKNSIVNPENVDAAAVELLKSGVMTSFDYEAMRSQFDGNNTMLRLMSHYAGVAADAMPDDKFSERSKLRAIAEATRNGDAAIINEWNNLVTMGHTLSGGNDRRSHEYVSGMAAQFETLMDDVIDSF